MTVCNNNDQTWSSATLKSARPGSAFNTTLGGQADINAKKNMFDPYNDSFLSTETFHLAYLVSSYVLYISKRHISNRSEGSLSTQSSHISTRETLKIQVS